MWPPPRGQQRGGHPQRVGDHHVVVGQPVDEQQRAGQPGRVGQQRGLRIHLRLIVRVAEVALGVAGVVQPPVGDRGARHRGVEHIRAAQHGQRGQVAAERPAADRDPAGVQVRVADSAAAWRASTWSSSTGPARSCQTSRSHSGPRPGVPRPSATSTAKPCSASHWEVRNAPCAESTRCACGPPYGSSRTGSRAVPGWCQDGNSSGAADLPGPRREQVRVRDRHVRRLGQHGDLGRLGGGRACPLGGGRACPPRGGSAR